MNISQFKENKNKDVENKYTGIQTQETKKS